MPELPEVETCRRIVERELTGRTVTAVVVRLPKLLRFSPIATLDPLTGCQVLAARRRAKILVIDFSGDLSLALHFKLAGQMSLHEPDGRRITAGHPVPDPQGPYPHKSTHIELHLDDQSVLYLSDLRQFSWYRLMPTPDIEPFLATYSFGPEGVGKEQNSLEELTARLQQRRIPVKTALLDQKVIAGLGNIYVDEALHRAHVHPAIPANSLLPGQLKALHASIPWVLERGIEQGGAKIVHNKAFPVEGFPAVHGREGEACPVCGSIVTKTRIGARGTYLCLVCQPAPL